METGYYLDSFLAPLAPVLARDDVTDIFINRPGEIWTESVTGGLAVEEIDGLDEKTLTRLARQIAAANAQGINRNQPLLAASLPDGSRVQIVAPPATRGGHAIAINLGALVEVHIRRPRVGKTLGGFRIEFDIH
mgnify:CR=1 FL=1